MKEKCRLSYNFANEERRKGPARREHIDLRVDSYADYKQFWVSSMYRCIGQGQVVSQHVATSHRVCKMIVTSQVLIGSSGL